MLALLTAGALAGLLSAPHCALMCGPIGLYSTRMAPSGLLRYQIGRLASYILAGVVAGSIGSPVLSLLWGSIAVKALSWALAGAMLVAAYRHWPRASKPVPEKLVSLSKKKTPIIARVLRRLPKRPEVLGATSLLLPCAALWTGVALAASSGTGYGGAIVMAAFASTSSLGFVASEAIARFLRHKPARNRIFSFLLVLAAIFFVMRPMSMAPSAGGEGAQVEHCPLHPGGMP